MFGLIKKCFEYAHIVPYLETFEQGRLIDIIELKLDLFCASMENKYKNKPSILSGFKDDCTNEENKELEKWSSAILLKDKINQYREILNSEVVDEELVQDLKIEIVKLIFEII